MLDFVSHMFWWFHSSVLEILVAIGALDSLYPSDVVVCGHLIRRGSLSVKMHVDVFDRLHQVPKKYYGPSSGRRSASSLRLDVFLIQPLVR